MPLPIQDALLLALLVGSMGVIIGGELSAFLRNRRGLATAFEALVRSPDLRKARQQPSARPAPRKPALRPSLHPMLPQVADLLVVDDSAVARTKLSRLFVAGGYKVQLANDGVEALDLLGKGQYGMMITDLEMPNMDGITLIHECLRQPQTAGMPIIAVSAHENLRATFNECRVVSGVHRKPWIDDLLLSHVATLIGTPNPALALEGPRLRGAA
jgi:CheY-like chemotaxis protein